MCLPLYVQAQTNFGPGQRDRFSLSLSSSPTYKETLSLFIDNSRKSKYEASVDALPQREYTLGFASLSSDGRQLLKDKRPYEPGNYYVDFPLSVKLETGKEYAFSVALMSGVANASAVIFRLIDNSNPDKFIDLLKESYTFEADNSSRDDNRFVARVYAASIFKENPVDNKWNNPDNWWGEIPGLNKEKDDKGVPVIDITNNCVIIPADTEIVISSDTEVSIGTLLNSGSLIIEKDAVLNIINEAQLASFSEVYLY
jgi:hypothetical protein